MLDKEYRELKKENEITRKEYEQQRKEYEQQRKAEEAARKAEEAARKAEEAARKAEEAEQEKKRKAELDAKIKETFDGIAELRKEVSGISNSNGRISEEEFLAALQKSKTFAGLYFETVDTLFTRDKTLPDGTRVQGQYDVVMRNGDTVAIIEVKYRARKDDIDHLIETQLKNFKLIFPEYTNYTVLLGLAGMTVDKSAETHAKQHGIAIIKTKGRDIIINDKNLKKY